MFKIELLFLSLNQDGETVPRLIVAHRPRRAEIPHLLDSEGTPICPGDGQGHHRTSGVELGRHLDVDALGMRLSSSAAFHIDHLPDNLEEMEFSCLYGNAARTSCQRILQKQPIVLRLIHNRPIITRPRSTSHHQGRLC